MGWEGGSWKGWREKRRASERGWIESLARVCGRHWEEKGLANYLKLFFSTDLTKDEKGWDLRVLPGTS